MTTRFAPRERPTADKVNAALDELQAAVAAPSGQAQAAAAAAGTSSGQAQQAAAAAQASATSAYGAAVQSLGHAQDAVGQATIAANSAAAAVNAQAYAKSSADAAAASATTAAARVTDAASFIATNASFANACSVQANVALSYANGANQQALNAAASARAAAASAQAANTVTAAGSPTARQLPDRFAERRSPRDWGAVLDGVTDDSAALKAACDALANTGSTLYIPGNARLLLGGAAQVTLQGVRLQGDGAWEFGAEAGHAYGTRGSTILIGDMTKPAFLVGDSWAVEGLVLSYPQQVEDANAPRACAATFVPAPNQTGQGVAYWKFIRNQVQGARVLFDLSSAPSAGHFWFEGNSVFALDAVFVLSRVGGETFVQNNQFSPAAYLTAVLGSQSFNLRNYYINNATVFSVVGDGTATTAPTKSVDGMRFRGNYMLFGSHVLHVNGGAYSTLATWESNSFDQVSQPILVENGGTIGLSVTADGWIAQTGYQGANFAAIKISGGVGGNFLNLTGVDFGAVLGPCIDWTDAGAASLVITGGKLHDIGNVAPGPFNGINFNAPQGRIVIAGTAITNTYSVNAQAGALGVNLNCLTSTVTGVSFEGWNTPYVNASASGTHTLVGCSSKGTTGSADTAGSGLGLVYQAGNVWALTPTTVSLGSAAITTSIQGALATNGTITATGPGANVAMTLLTKGQGGVVVNGGSSTLFQLLPAGTSQVNWPTLQGASTGNGVVLGGAGSDANIDVAINPKGTGAIKLGLNPAGRLAFFASAGSTKPSLSGSRGGNAALASLISALAGLGLLTDGTTS